MCFFFFWDLFSVQLISRPFASSSNISISGEKIAILSAFDLTSRETKDELSYGSFKAQIHFQTVIVYKHGAKEVAYQHKIFLIFI